MTIKEIIDKERWVEGWKITTEEANKTLDLIEDAVTKRIAELETAKDNYKQMVVEQKQRITELEAALDVRDRKLSDISSACESAGCLYDEAMDEFIFKQKQRIAELEAQNLNMMALFRDFYELEFNRDECWEIIKKYGGDA